MVSIVIIIINIEIVITSNSINYYFAYFKDTNLTFTHISNCLISFNS